MLLCPRFSGTMPSISQDTGGLENHTSSGATAVASTLVRIIVNPSTVDSPRTNPSIPDLMSITLRVKLRNSSPTASPPLATMHRRPVSRQPSVSSWLLTHLWSSVSSRPISLIAAHQSQNGHHPQTAISLITANQSSSWFSVSKWP
jgi:hypothetical protein